MSHKYIISGGGTGGHIFPAVAIANSLRSHEPDCEILFIGASGRMEMEKVPQEGYRIIGLQVSGLIRSFHPKNILVITRFIKSYFKAKKIIREFQPHCVVGTGGYASLAIGYAAGKMGIPLVIWEGNGYAGLTNKLLAKFASTICTGLPGMDRFFPAEKVSFTGNPVRENIIHLPSKEAGLNYFGFHSDKPVLFITGGSLGARTINQSIQNGINILLENGVQIIWQTGKNFEAKTRSGSDIYVSPFLKEMHMAYAASDLVISRAGALSISEITCAKKPSILVPSPNVTDDHQTKNAQVLASANAAILIKDQQAADELVIRALDCLANKKLLENMTQNAASLARPDATETISRLILNVSKK